MTRETGVTNYQKLYGPIKPPFEDLLIAHHFPWSIDVKLWCPWKYKLLPLGWLYKMTWLLKNAIIALGGAAEVGKSGMETLGHITNFTPPTPNLLIQT